MKKFRYAAEVWLVAAAASMLRKLPRHVLLAAAQVVGVLAWMLDARGRQAALENVRTALGLRTFWARHRVVIGSYQNFARSFFDLFWSPELTASSWQDCITVDGLTQDKLQRCGSGSIWVTPHYGNFEFAALVMGFAGLPMNIVAQDFKNPGLTGIFQALRQGSGHTVIPQDGAMIRLFKGLKRGQHAAFLTDLNFKPSQATAAVRCFGMMTCVTTMHALLALRTGLPIVPAVCDPLPDGRYVFRVLEILEPVPNESPRALAQRVWDVFEPSIRACPERWMWMYKHWRYLPDPSAAAAYPDYAGRNKDFAAQCLAD